MKHLYTASLIVALLSPVKSFLSQVKNSVMLKGIARNFANQIQVADISALSNFSLPDLQRTFLPDSNGMFQISFTIDKPNYFKVGRNVLYLSPGDSLSVEIDYEYAENAVFTGKGAEANIYLKKTPFPKAGSFLNAGKSIKNNFETTIKEIFSVASQREKELSGLKNITNEFKELEIGRIRSDIINSLFDLRYYYRDEMPKDSADLFNQEYIKKGALLIKELSSGFYKPTFLNLEVYRDILHIIVENSDGLSKDNKNRNSIESWSNANKIANKLKNLSDKDSIKYLKSGIESLANATYKNLLKKMYRQRIAFGNGDVAKNFIAFDENDDTVSLDNFKGSAIYLELWATWCGPCLAEAPYFDSLREKYKNGNIVFISLSIDSETDKWKKFLQSKKASGNQWVIDRLKLEEYSVTGVPRTILIDKEFKVVDMYGPKPSSQQTEGLIKKMIE